VFIVISVLNALQELSATAAMTRPATTRNAKLRIAKKMNTSMLTNAKLAPQARL
jgi:hypothetical protein